MLKASLNRVLTAIAKQLSLSPEKLIQYAHEAPYAKATPAGKVWPSGTGSVSEKRILYAIARGLNAELSLDIGTRWGASAIQIADGDKRVISVDVETHMYGSKQPVGKFIPNTLRVNLVTSDAMLYLKMDTLVYTLIYEDTDHTFESTEEIYKLAIDRLIAGGVIISHDACHPKFKGAVVAGIRACGIEPQVYLVEGDSCGLSIWQKPKDDDVVIETPYRQVLPGEGTGNDAPIIQGVDCFISDQELPTPEAQEEITETPAPKRKKRKATKRKKKTAKPKLSGDEIPGFNDFIKACNSPENQQRVRRAQEEITQRKKSQ